MEMTSPMKYLPKHILPACFLVIGLFWSGLVLGQDQPAAQGSPDTTATAAARAAAPSANSSQVPSAVSKSDGWTVTKIFEKMLLPIILAFVLWLIRQVYKNVTTKWLQEVETIKKQLIRLEFQCSREGIYRELDRYFVHWSGVENCVIFTEEERRVVRILKAFAGEEVQPWLAPYDRLMLGIYWDVYARDRSRGIGQIDAILAQADVPSEVQASCYLQKARMMAEEQQNNYQAIYHLLENASKLNPANISIRFLEAKLRNETGDYKIAATILDDIRKMPNAGTYPINIDLTLADVCISMKDYKKALNLVENYLMFHPYHVKSIKSKASIYYSDTSLPESAIIQFCNQIEAINVGDDPELHYAVALLEYRLHKYAEAERRLNSIIMKKPSFIDYRSLLANIYFELNNQEKLLETLRVMRSLLTNPGSKRQVGRIIHSIETDGIEKTKHSGQFNILLKYP